MLSYTANIGAVFIGLVMKVIECLTQKSILQTLVSNKRTEIKLISKNMLVIPVLLYIALAIYQLFLKPINFSKIAKLLLRLTIVVGMYAILYPFLINFKIRLSDHVWCSFLATSLLRKLDITTKKAPKNLKLVFSAISLFYQVMLVYSLIFTAYIFHSFTECIYGIILGLIADFTSSMLIKLAKQYI